MTKSAPRRLPTPASRRFGLRIRQLRQQRNWNLEELAGRADMHATYISSVENGHRNPTLAVIVSLARAFNVSVSELTATI